jgi:aminopeptidase N
MVASTCHMAGHPAQRTSAFTMNNKPFQLNHRPDREQHDQCILADGHSRHNRHALVPASLQKKWGCRSAPMFWMLVAAMAISCATANAQESDPAWRAPDVERSVSVRDGRTNELIQWSAWLDSLSDADVVFLGEAHDDETTHRVELAVYSGLLQRKKNQVILAMEMFERDVQGQLDQYLAGEIDEQQFLAHARPWNNYRTAYRPLIEKAKAVGRPVIASNFPQPLRRRMAKEGSDILKKLAEDESHQAPIEYFPNRPQYWRRVDNAVRGHLAMVRGRDGDDQRLYSTQSLWDNSMGEACAKALDQHPGNLVLHVNGGFHSEYWDGTVHQLRRRKPDAKIKTVAIRSVMNPAVADVEGKPVADYVVFAESRASDRNDGMWAVDVPRTLRYRFHLPKKASENSRVPLLLWFANDSLTARDGLDLWKDRLGESAAIAVIEAPYRAVLTDLSTGGRWFWPDSFASDVQSMITGAERVWGYLLRHYPIDSSRVCIAGEGTGATVAIAIGLLTSRIDGSTVAFGPEQYAKIKDFPLPLPEEWGDDRPPQRSIRVVSSASDKNWWRDELQQYSQIGVESEFVPLRDDRWSRELDAENVLCQALGLKSRSGPTTKQRRYILVEGESARAHFWARLHALRATEADGIPVAVSNVPLEAADASGEQALERLSMRLDPDAFGAKGALPPCPGPFGGTTVLVLPDATKPAIAKRWNMVAKNDPLAKESRFHRIRIASTHGPNRLSAVLAKLRDENRKSILIVPATFCASALRMQSLSKIVEPFENEMTIRWLPGLGGQITPFAYGESQNEDLPLQHNLSVTVEPEKHRIAVRDEITLPRSLARPGLEFTLGGDLTIRSSEPAVEPIPSGSTTRGEPVRYRLTEAPIDGRLQLAYDGVVKHALSDTKEEYTRGFRQTRGTVSTEGIYLDADSHWIPRFDDRMIRFQMDVETPDGWQMISQGKGTSSDDSCRARWESEGAVEQVYLVGGPLHVWRETAGTVETAVYLHEEDEALARKYLDATARYIEMYRQLIGPYPYSKFALVENFWETGYGMPSFTLLGPQVIRFPFILTSSYPHEILHNWWGNSVFVDYEQGNWCEGLTAYMADHLIQEQQGKGAVYRRGTLQKYRDYVKEGRDFPLDQFRNRHSASTEAVGYGKALMTFHMLRRRVGDANFKAALADFYRKNRGRRASFQDLQIAFENVTGIDLGLFFTQWTTRTGAPALRVDNTNVQETPDGFVVRGTIQQIQSDDPFELVVPVTVQTVDGTEQFEVKTDGRSQSFQWTNGSRPLALSVDSRFDLFRRLDPLETPPSIGQIFGEPHIWAVLPSSAEETTQAAYRRLIERWKTENHAIEPRTDIEIESLPKDRSIWLFGKENRLAEQLFGDVTEENQVRIGEELVPFQDHSIVLLRRHPENKEKVVGWLVVDPPDAFAGMARKLPHYGKYTYLAFEGPEPTNVVKGQGTATESPLVVDLREDRSEPVAVSDSTARQPLAELPPVFSQRAIVEHVQWLASPQRAGRGLGSPELAKSAEYIAEKMADAGLSPAGDDGSWFQRFTVQEGPDGEPVEAVNVVGLLPGKRKDWTDQSIVLGAHYDHLGRGWPESHSKDAGKVHPGADDNASGVAVLLELAKNIASSGGGSRNLVFVAFSAEECGRHGSRHYIEHPRFPVGEIRGMINLDGVGRLFDRKLAIHGTGTADEWQHIFRGCGFVTGIPSQNVPDFADGSDQMSFIEKGIPAVQIFSGVHKDYHRPTDTADRIDGPGLVKVATFVKESVTYLLERPEPLSVRIESNASEANGERAKPSSRRVQFGTVPAYAFTGDGAKIESIVNGSPAAKAGLRAGDVIVQLNEQKIADVRAFSNFLKSLVPGQEVKATVRRGETVITTSVTVVAR